MHCRMNGLDEQNVILSKGISVSYLNVIKEQSLCTTIK